MFLHLSVSHSVHFTGGAMSATPPGRHPLRADTPPGQTPPCPVHAGIHTPLPSACWDTPPCAVHAGIQSVNKWAVRIPLECILVWKENAPRDIYLSRAVSQFQTESQTKPSAIF